jgi:hypothetical protein
MTKNNAPVRAGQAVSDRSFIPDDEFFRRYPHAICRVRRWRNEDDEHVLGSRGDENEFFTASLVFRDGRIYAAYFPDPFDQRKRPLKRRVSRWAIEMMVDDRRQQP